MAVSLDSGGDGTGQRPIVDPSLPQVFGRYLLVQRLSRGGMGEIFVAKHGLAGFEKLAVIKKVLPNFAEDKQFISRFVDEAQVAIKLQHVNVAQVFEVGRVGDEYFLALEHVEGRDLRRTLTKLERTQRRCPVDLALYIAREMANGLAYAHRRVDGQGNSLNLVHCDISPPNVLVSFEGETKIIDFGIAKSALRATASDPKMGFGKFGYMAPEQLIRGGVVDFRTDIYAAGVVLYELLTGQRLYDPSNPDYRALARAVAKGEHKLPSQHDAALAPYDTLITRALRPKPDERYQSAAEYRDAIQAALVNVNPTISTDQLGSWMRDIFADEMAAQREINDRVARTHLADYHDQFNTQIIETVSFAVADQAPKPLPVASAAPTLGDGTGAMELSLGGDLDGELAGTETTAVPPIQLRKKTPVLPFVLAGATFVALVIVVLAFAGGGDTKPKPAPPADDTATNVVAPPPADVTPDADDGGTTVVMLDEPPDPPTAKKDRDKKDRDKKDRDRDRDKKDRDKDKDKDKDKGGSAAASPAPVDEGAAVRAKAAAVSREYKAFEKKFGSRLADEWAAVASEIQYAKSADQWKAIERKLDRLRAKMREQ